MAQRESAREVLQLRSRIAELEAELSASNQRSRTRADASYTPESISTLKSTPRTSSISLDADQHTRNELTTKGNKTNSATKQLKKAKLQLFES